MVARFATRHAAVLMIFFTIIATLLSHRFWELSENAWRVQEIMFAKNVAIIGGFLFLFVHGGGLLSLDRMLWRRGKG